MPSVFFLSRYSWMTNSNCMIVFINSFKKVVLDGSDDFVVEVECCDEEEEEEAVLVTSEVQSGSNWKSSIILAAILGSWPLFHFLVEIIMEGVVHFFKCINNCSPKESLKYLDNNSNTLPKAFKCEMDNCLNSAKFFKTGRNAFFNGLFGNTVQ